RHDGDPRGPEDLEAALGEDRAPLRSREEEDPAAAAVVERDRRATTDDVTEEPELAEDEEDRARLERRRHREQRQEIRQRVPHEDPELGQALRPRGLEE